MAFTFALSFLFFLPGDLMAQTGAKPIEEKTLDKKTKADIIDSISAAMNEIYVFPEVAEKMEQHIRQNFKDKKYDEITNLYEFTDKLTQDLREISHDGHLAVFPLAEDDFTLAEADTLSDEKRRKMIEQLRYINFGFVKLERLEGNVGYLDLRRFCMAEFAGETAIAAMNFLSNCEAIIIDLRQNGGGEPSMIQLITSYFFNEPVHLNSFYIRKTDSIQQFWTQAHVQGPRMTDVDLYILTSGMTYSGAEEFTYNLKNLKRATIVGETTGGGAHPTEGRAFANLGVDMSLPFGRAINPITGTNWERTGVEPDIKVEQAKALEVAYLMALKKLSEKTKNAEKKYRLDWAVTGLEARQNPVEVDEAVLKAYAGTYGPRTITFEDGKLHYQRVDRPKFVMIPMSEDLFRFEEIDYFRLKVLKDEKGDPIALEGLYADGFTDKSIRDK